MGAINYEMHRLVLRLWPPSAPEDEAERCGAVSEGGLGVLPEAVPNFY